MLNLDNLKILIAVIITLLVSYSFHTCSLDRAVSDQKTKSENECSQAKLITTEVDNGLQNNLSAIDKRLNDKLMQPSVCVQPSFDTTDTHAASGSGSTRPNGLSTKWLNQYAAQCATYRAKVMSFQEFVLKERE